MNLPPRDSKGRFISYKECTKRQCKQVRSELVETQAKLSKSSAKITHLQSTLNKESKSWITPAGIFFAFLALVLMIAIIFEKTSE